MTSHKSLKGTHAEAATSAKDLTLEQLFAAKEAFKKATLGEIAKTFPQWSHFHVEKLLAEGATPEAVKRALVLHHVYELFSGEFQRVMREVVAPSYFQQASYIANGFTADKSDALLSFPHHFGEVDLRSLMTKCINTTVRGNSERCIEPAFESVLDTLEGGNGHTQHLTDAQFTSIAEAVPQNTQEMAAIAESIGKAVMRAATANRKRSVV